MITKRGFRFGSCFSLTMALLLVVTLMPAPQPLQAQTNATNLIANPGFETEENPWAMCGDSERVDAQAAGVTKAMVHSGRYAARLRYNTDDLSCGGEAFFDPTVQISQPFMVPADAQDLTISFWYSRIGDTLFPLEPILGVSSDYAERDVTLARVTPEELEGWSLYRTELTLEELEAVRGKSISLHLSIFTTFAGAADTTNATPQAAAEGSYYIDDVRVVATVERTTPSPLPDALKGDDTRPIAYLDAALGGVARMNPDGSGGQLLYNGLNPVWSSAGDRIAVLKSSLTPENTTDPRINPAFISILSTINPDGGHVQEIYRTTGTPGAVNFQDEIPALDVEIYSMDWSPDDQQMALTICSHNRRSNGSTSDSICWIELIEVATGESKGKIEAGTRPNWGSNNKILFQNTDAYEERTHGIWEMDRSKNPPIEQLLVPGTGERFDPSSRVDRLPVWSPDNTKFVTLRQVAGLHYDAGGSIVTHEAIMLFMRAGDDYTGEMILLIDQGREPAGITWSPDGNYIFYSLVEGQGGDIWWLDVNTRATGKVTTNGASLAPSWRLECPDTPCGDPAAEEMLHLPLVRP